MNKKYLKIIDEEGDKKMVSHIAEMIEKMNTAMTPLQIENFVLNDVEFPTEYGKFLQAQLELANRFSRIIDLYYDFKETDIEIKKIERKLDKEEDDLERELLELRKEKAELKLQGLKNQLKNVISEARVFYKIYNKNPEFHELSPEEAFKLEAENWAKKTINMPTTFEERYGEGYMIKALGEENYKKYKELRQKSLGLLPREIFGLKQLKEGKE